MTDKKNKKNKVIIRKEKKSLKNSKYFSWLFSDKNKYKIMLFVLFLLFGAIVSTHIRSVQQNYKKSSLNEQYTETQQEIIKLEATYQQLLAENERLVSQRDEAIDTILDQQGYEELSSEINRIRILAGFTEVTGEGIVVTLDDKPGYDPLKDPVASIIHDGNIRHVVNLLINNGAAAISINGMRLVNSSYIYCIGPTILCNRERMTPPYVISAIGPAELMETAALEDQVLNQLKIPEIGVIIEVEKKEQIVIPPFAEADNFDRYINLLEVVNK